MGTNRENYRINVDTGETIVDGTLAPSTTATSPADANFSAVQAAYINSFSLPATSRPAISTNLYDIDGNNNKLLFQNTANNGQLEIVGALGSSVVSYGGFDIAGGDNGARLLAARTTGAGPFSLFDVNVSTGAATLVGNLTTTATDAAVIGGTGGPADLRDIAIRYSGNR